MITKLHELTGLSEKQISKWQWDQIHKENNSGDFIMETPKRGRMQDSNDEYSRIYCSWRKPPSQVELLEMALLQDKQEEVKSSLISEKLLNDTNESPAKSSPERRIFEPLVNQQDFSYRDDRRFQIQSKNSAF